MRLLKLSSSSSVVNTESLYLGEQLIDALYLLLWSSILPLVPLSCPPQADSQLTDPHKSNNDGIADVQVCHPVAASAKSRIYD